MAAAWLAIDATGVEMNIHLALATGGMTTEEAEAAYAEVIEKMNRAAAIRERAFALQYAWIDRHHAKGPDGRYLVAPPRNLRRVIVPTLTDRIKERQRVEALRLKKVAAGRSRFSFPSLRKAAAVGTARRRAKPSSSTR
jgi:hypothetical protein